MSRKNIIFGMLCRSGILVSLYSRTKSFLQKKGGMNFERKISKGVDLLKKQ
jgi:hypothetical protein